MSDRALAVAAALHSAMPEVVVSTGEYTTKAEFVDTAHGPMIVVADGIAQGFTLTVYAGDGDQISDLAADLFRATRGSAYALGYDGTPAELLLSFQEGEALINADGFHIGERLHFTAIEHNTPFQEAS